jgi:polyferredoxin
VQVCPTGIDIRNGLQIQCISCALCIDACDTIMDSLGWERGLVGYSSERVTESGQKARLLRPKVIGYASILVLAVGLLAWSVSQQAAFDLTVSQVRQPIYVRLSDGRIQNSYEIKINNKTGQSLRMRFGATGLPPQAELDMGHFREVELHPEQRLRLAAKVRMMPQEFDGASHPFEFVAEPLDAPTLSTLTHPSVFYVPER